jgi:hypothetical protein
MALSEAALNSILHAQLTPAERACSLVYAFADPVPAGTELRFPHIKFKVPWEALLAFVDREPQANWGHSCRYLLLDRETGQVLSKEARFPPFRQEELRRWKVSYQAPGIPDSLIAIPKW